MKARIAADVMTRKVITARPEMLVTEVMELILRNDTSCLPVVDDHGQLVGIITEYDIMNFAFSGVADRTRVGEAMSKEVFSWTPDTDIETVVNSCLTRRIHRAPVVQDGKVIGIISRRDILREILHVYSKY
ncbi:MAG: CBS domain-containing protein [Armatimonadota bacterium]